MTTAAELKSLADFCEQAAVPVRLRVLRLLWGRGEMALTALAAAVGCRPRLLARHLKPMRSAGVVDQREDGRVNLYRLSPRASDLIRIALADPPDPT